MTEIVADESEETTVIKTPTLLILGAGASNDFGFPTGIELWKRICDGEPFRPRDPLTEFGYSEDIALAFRKALLHSGQLSVDAFLEHRPDFRDVGKAAIAASLIPHENESGLFTPSKRRTWYHLLFERMATEFDAIARNAIAVLTFSYDRSLEHFLYTALKNTYDRTDDDCASVVTQIPIVHLHGALGRYGYGESPGLPYNSGVNRSSVRSAAQSIRIVHESIEGDAEFEQAHRLIATTQQVFFLGFGFHLTNLQRLALPTHLSKHALVYATCLGLTAAERGTIRKRCEFDIKWGDEGDSILDFLRKTPAFLRA